MNRAMHLFSPLPLGEGRGRGKESTQRASPYLLPLSQWARGIVAVAALLLPALGAQSGAPELANLNQQIAICALQSDTSVRLACYDALAAQLAAASTQSAAPANSAGTDPINEENALFKLSCAYFSKDC